MKKIALILGLFLVLSIDAKAETSKIDIMKEQFLQCSDILKSEQKKCPNSWSTKCYYSLMKANQNTQKCYKKIAVDLFETYYGLSQNEAEKKFDSFSKFIYEQYLYVFSETDYCQRNNCGISLYLYSEYTTTEELQTYISKIIGSISARN